MNYFKCYFVDKQACDYSVSSNKLLIMLLQMSPAVCYKLNDTVIS